MATPDSHLEPHWRSAALLVVDLQRDFLDDGAAPVEGTSALVAPAVRLVQAFRAAGRPVVHVVRLYSSDGVDVDTVRRAAIESGVRIVAPGTDGAEPAVGLLPGGARLNAHLLLSGRLQVVGEREAVVFKPRWSAFHRTALDDWLVELGCDTVVVAGCNLPNCPRATLTDATERDLRAVLATDAVSRSSPERLGDLAAIGVVLMPTDEIVSHLARL